MENLLFSINAIAPVFVIVFFGVFLKKRRIINDNFVNTSTDVVFKIALPALLFRDVAKTDFESVFNLKLIFFAVGGTVAAFLVLWAACSYVIKDARTLGAFVQGAFRSNFAILGLPLASNLFGRAGLAKSAIILAFIIPLYNVLAIVILTVASPKTTTVNKAEILLNILKNPLIWGVALAIPFSLFRITLPEIAVKSIDYLAGLTMPLALLGMGGSFNFTGVKSKIGAALSAAFIKILLLPLTFTFLAIFTGFRGEELGALFILFASPTAVSSFIMAKVMDSDAELASHIILITTLGSILTTFAGIFLLKTAGMI